MSFLDEYIHGNWRQSAHNMLARLLEHECRPNKDSRSDGAERIDVALAQEQTYSVRSAIGTSLACLATR